jgi:8-oxo-dGTP pyrophosphatase MutT (NUDIX family)
MRAEHNTFLTREDGREFIEAHVAGVCMRKIEGEWHFLAAQRTADRSLFPGKWECGGGMIRPNEGFAAAIRRQIFEEFGLDVEPYQLLEAYEIHGSDQGIAVNGDRSAAIIPGIRWVCLTHAGKVRLNKREFARYRWLKWPGPKSLDWIGEIREAVSRIVLDQLPDDGPSRKTIKKHPGDLSWNRVVSG